jgi:hypothetical protein
MKEDSATSSDPPLLYCDDPESHLPKDKAQEQDFQPALIEGTALLAWLSFDNVIDPDHGEVRFPASRALYKNGQRELGGGNRAYSPNGNFSRIVAIPLVIPRLVFAGLHNFQRCKE